MILCSSSLYLLTKIKENTMRNLEQSELAQINGGNMVSFVSALTLNQNGYDMLPSIGIASVFSCLVLAAENAATVGTFFTPYTFLSVFAYGALGYSLSYLTTAND